jgi:glucosamine--fructose-6-phosphate aminotransferase (isomerizing)
MCGIVGYIGTQNSAPILIDGLKRLEYRGYDSAGLGIFCENNLNVVKAKGKVSVLETKAEQSGLNGTLGIGHTRWATHGIPNETNAHPHFSADETLLLVHNGIIENYATLKEFLLDNGYEFRSETDTEVLVNLIDFYYKQNQDLLEAVRQALLRVDGTFGIAVISKNEPDKIVVAKNGSPLVIGIGDNENFVASDVNALIAHTKKVIYLEDNEIGYITKDSYLIKSLKNEALEKEISEIDMDLDEITKGGYPHYMLKEIMEQPESLANTFRGRYIEEEGIAKLGGLIGYEERILNSDRIIITACGTSWHAALVGEYLFEQYAGIPVEVEYASEFRYRNPIIGKNDTVIFISQSGETADTLAALKEAKRKGALTVGIVNVVGSSIARASDTGVYIHAGPEIGVASTKAFTSQVMTLALITLLLARMKNMSLEEGKEIIHAIQELPAKVQEILNHNSFIEKVSGKLVDAKNFLYLGRGLHFPVALEGALKLKEISYIHAEGYPAAEMKHGPIALIDENMPSVFIAPKDAIYDKVLNNIEEVKARNGQVLAIADKDDNKIDQLADYVIKIPRTHNMLMPILTVIPLQLLAYHIAVKKGLNVDQPRNLAKSVTVE